MLASQVQTLLSARRRQRRQRRLIVRPTDIRRLWPSRMALGPWESRRLVRMVCLRRVSRRAQLVGEGRAGLIRLLTRGAVLLLLHWDSLSVVDRTLVTDRSFAICFFLSVVSQICSLTSDVWLNFRT